MRLRILSLPVSMPRWQFRRRFRSNPRQVAKCRRWRFPGVWQSGHGRSACAVMMVLVDAVLSHRSPRDVTLLSGLV